MKKVRGVLIVLVILIVLGGCGRNVTEQECECLVELTGLPKDMDKLDENIREQLYVSLTLENIYTKKRVQLRLREEDGFKKELELAPGTYRVLYYYASDRDILPWEVKEKRESVELVKGKKEVLQMEVTNPEEVTDWIWNMQAGREILQADAFSHKVQYGGQMMDVEVLVSQMNFEYEGEIQPYDMKEITSNEGITIVMLNETEDIQDWRNCTLKSIAFSRSDIIWAQGAYVGMEVKKAVHAEEGLYGKPTGMSGTILAGADYAQTNVSWLDGKSGDKLTLRIHADGSHIDRILYEFAVYE